MMGILHDAMLHAMASGSTWPTLGVEKDVQIWP